MSHNVPELSDQQLQAIDLLASCAKIGDIAEKLQISRRTLWRWRQEPAFQAAWAQQRALMRESLHSRATALAAAAFDVLERTLQMHATYGPGERQVNTALHFLRLFQKADLAGEEPSSTPQPPAPSISHKDA